MSGTLIPLMGTDVDGIKPLQEWQNVLATEANRYKTLAETGTERERPALVRAQAGETGARTGLIGAQTVGQQIQNVLSGLQAQFRSDVPTALSNSPYEGGVGRGLPWAGAATGGSGGGTGVDLVTPGRPAQPVSSNPLAMYAADSAPANALAPAASGNAGSDGQGQFPGGPVDASSAWQSGTSANGRVIPGMAGPISKYDFLAIKMAPDPAKAMAEVEAKRARALYQLASGATDVPSWNQAVKTAWEAGLITNGSALHLWDRFDYKDAVERQYASPEAGIGYQTALAGHQATPGPTGPVPNPALLSTQPPVTIKMLSPDGKRVIEQTIPKPAYVAGVGAPGGAPAAAAPAAAGSAAAGGGAMPAQQWAAMVNGQENGTGNPAARNPRSSAAGNGQFLDDTWLHTIKQARPDLAAGRSDADLLAMRSDPNLSQDMTAALARENAPVLAQQGIPVNASTLRLAHWFGPQGAANIFHGAQNAPIESLVPAKVIAANPSLRGETVRSLVTPVVSRFGLGPVDLAQQTGASLLGGGAPAAAAAPAPAAPADAAAPAGAIPGAIPGAVSLTPEAENAIKLDTPLVEKDASYVADLQDSAKASLQAQTQLFNIRDVAHDLPTGAFGDARASLANVFKTFGGDWADRFLKATTGIDPEKAGSWQELAKQTLTVAGQAENQVAGSRGGFNLVRLYQKSFPGLDTQPDALQEMVNLFMIGHQYTIDHAQGAQPFYQENRAAFRANPVGTPYQPLSTFDQQFMSQEGTHAPKVYVAAAALLNGHPKGQALAGLTPDQQVEAVRTMMRADPTAAYTPRARH